MKISEWLAILTAIFIVLGLITAVAAANNINSVMDWVLAALAMLFFFSLAIITSLTIKPQKENERLLGQK